MIEITTINSTSVKAERKRRLMILNTDRPHTSKSAKEPCETNALTTPKKLDTTRESWRDEVANKMDSFRLLGRRAKPLDSLFVAD